MTEKMIIEVYCRIRTIDNTIPDDVLDFMKDAAIEKLSKRAFVKQNDQLKDLLEKLLENNMCSHAGDELIKEVLKSF